MQDSNVIAFAALEKEVVELEHQIVRTSEELRRACSELEEGRLGHLTRNAAEALNSLLTGAEALRQLIGGNAEEVSVVGLRAALKKSSGASLLVKMARIVHQDPASDMTVAMEKLTAEHRERADAEPFLTSARALLRLIEEADRLSDEESEELHTAVMTVFPMSVALAAARGRLSLQEPVSGAEAQTDQVSREGPLYSGDLPTISSMLALNVEPDRTTPSTLPSLDPAKLHSKIADSIVSFKKAKMDGTFRPGRSVSRQQQAESLNTVTSPFETPIELDSTPDWPENQHTDVLSTETEASSRLEEPSEVLSRVTLDSPPNRADSVAPASEMEGGEPAEDELKTLTLAVWEAAARGEWALAAYARDLFNLKDPPEVALRLALDGQAMAAAEERAQQQFEETAQQTVGDLANLDEGASLLVFAGLVPAVLAGAPSATALLRDLSLPGILGELQDALCTLENILYGAPLVEVLQAARNEKAWHDDLAQLRRRLVEEQSRANVRTINYAVATKVWQTFWLSGGILGEPFTRALSQDPAKGFEAPDYPQAEVNRQIRKANPGRIEIMGPALRHIRSMVESSFSLLEEWAELLKQRPDSDYRAKSTAQFLGTWETLRGEVAALDVRALARRDVAALGALQYAVTDADLILTGAASTQVGHEHEVRVQSLLQVGISSSQISDARPLETARTDVREALMGLSDSTRILNRFLERHDFRRAWHVIELMDGEAGVQAQALWNEQADAARQRAQHTHRQVSQRLEASLYQNLLTESEGQQVEQHLLALGEQLQHLNTDVGEVRRQLEQIDLKLGQMYQRQADRLVRRLEELNLSETDRGRIREKLGDGDFQTVQEYLDYVDRKEALPSDQHGTRLFDGFFPEQAEAIDRYLEDFKQPERVLQHLDRRDARYVPDITGLPGGQQKTARAMLEAWFAAKSAKHRLDVAVLTRLMEGLGFTLSRNPGAVPGDPNHAWDVQVSPVSDRNVIPIEVYGSRSGGHYRILPFWDRPSEEQILEKVGLNAQPTLVLYFGRLTQQRRRSLHELCRRRRRTFVVIDELLIMALTAVRGSRLPVLFQLALPFTSFSPYTLTGSNVSPEMFYGRDQELAALMDENGPSILYGGRQLGKSALLRHLERMHDRPDQGMVVRWIDLKSQQVGHGREIQHIWSVIARVLGEAGVLSGQLPTKVERLSSSISQWLAQNPHRRIVLLLDEADQFLLADGLQEVNGVPAYHETSHLKNLMEQTSRRFKVVLAGTHNVLKYSLSATGSNSPLVHLGTPIKIGPMVSPRERRDAYALITEPLGLLGYRFEPPDLPYRILARTNYYPSLIQIYGHYLLEHLHERAHLGFPPVITSEHVDGVYQSRELRKDILDRFIWTLRLDTRGRYEAVAYALAYEVKQATVDLERGVTAEQLIHLAMHWLPSGFLGKGGSQITSREDMRSVAEEMEGLGILRHTPEDNFTFRTPNVLAMLGTLEEISSTLIDIQERYAQAAQLGEASHREHLPSDPSWTSPLTSNQLFNITRNQHGVSIVIGSAATRVDQLDTLLVRTLGAGSINRIPANLDLAGFRAHIAGRTGADGYQLHLINEDVPWTSQWIQAAQQRTKNLKSERFVTRFVFVGGPDRLNEAGTLRNEDVQLVAHPWNAYEVHAWMESQGTEANLSTCNLVLQGTGFWPAFLTPFFKRVLQIGASAALTELQQRSSIGQWSYLNLTEDELTVLQRLSEVGGSRPEELGDFASLCQHGSGQQMDSAVVEETLDRARRQQLVEEVGGVMQVTPMLMALLT